MDLAQNLIISVNSRPICHAEFYNQHSRLSYGHMNIIVDYFMQASVTVTVCHGRFDRSIEPPYFGVTIFIKIRSCSGQKN